MYAVIDSVYVSIVQILLETGEAARKWPIVFHLTLLTFMELAEDGEKFGGTAKARQDFPQSITVDSIKGLGQVYETCI